MRRVEIVLVCAAGLVCATPAFAQSNAAQSYNRADTFEPGKKYTCVPTADHKGWDCNEAGKSVEIKPRESEVTHPAAAATQAPSEPPPSPAPSAQPASRSTLPSYLTNAAANNPAPAEEPPSTVSAAAAHAKSPPAPTTASTTPARASTPAVSIPATPTKTVPLRAATPKTGDAPPPPPRSPTKPPLPPRVTHPPVVEAASGGSEFMSLPGDHFVVELARAASERELAAVKSSTHVANGTLYDVHLRQNGADSWLLLWGTFDSIEAARAARNTISASAAPGWPRRIAPLQAEARRSSP